MPVLKMKIGSDWIPVGGTQEVIWTGPSAPVDTSIDLWVDTDETSYPWNNILPNNTFLQGYKSDGTTAQSLIGVRTDNNIALGTGLPTNGGVVLSNTVWLSGLRTNATIQNLVFVNSDDSVHVAYATPKPLYLGQAAQDDIFIGGSLAAGKNIFVPRLTVQGQLTLQADNVIASSNGISMMNPATNGYLYLSDNSNLWVNGTSGSSYFLRDVHVAGVLYKYGGAPYTHPDFVFEHAFTGKIDKFIDAPGAKEYQGLLSLRETEIFIREHWRLPHQERDGKYDLFRRGDELLAEIERLYLHLFELNKRIEALER